VRAFHCPADEKTVREGAMETAKYRYRQRRLYTDEDRDVFEGPPSLRRSGAAYLGADGKVYVCDWDDVPLVAYGTETSLNDHRMSTLRQAADEARKATDQLLVALDRYDATDDQQDSEERTAERAAARQEMFQALRQMPFHTFKWVWEDVAAGVSGYPRMLEQVEES
jgi:hypothetical protein